MRAIVEIEGGSASAHRVVLPVGVTTIGSGPAADVVPRGLTSLAPVHLALDPVEAGCEVRVTADVSIPFALNGTEHRTALVPWGTEIFVGTTRLAFFQASTGGSRVHPALLVPCLVCVLLVLAQLYRTHRSVETAESTLEPPPLGAEDTSCPRKEARAARHLAEQSEAGARSKRERSPFSTRDGVEALALYARSTACYRTAGAPQDAARVERLQRSWSARLSQAYSATRLRLRLALSAKRHAEALGAARALESLLTDQPDDPYVRWLGKLRRKLEAETKPHQ